MDNNIFQLKRVWLLFRRTFQQNSKMLLNNALILAGLPILFLLLGELTSGEGPSLSFRSDMLTFLVIVFFIFSSFFYYYFYNHPKKGLSEVMLPASVMEKFVAMQIYCVFFAPLMVLVFFGGSDALLTTLFPKYQTGYAIVDIFRNSLFIDGFLLSFLSLQALFFCNMFFVRRKLLKTASSFMAVNILSMIIIAVVIKIIDLYGYFDTFSDTMTINVNGRGLFEFYKEDHPLVTFGLIIRIFIETVMPIIFMIGSYRIMKTKRY